MLNFKSLNAKADTIPWILIILVTLISFIGFCVLYSAAGGSIEPWAIKQIIRFIILLPIMLIIGFIPLRFWYQFSYIFYAFSVIALVLTLLIGKTAMGATRWLEFAGISIQTSELMKITLALAMARYFSNLSYINTWRIYYLIIPVLMALIPAALIMKQPDLGTAMIVLFLTGFILFAVGVKKWKFIAIFALAIALSPIIWSKLHDYQKDRVITFINPEKDALGKGYNIIQSKIAIGSGGFSGKGFLEGTQSRLSYVPEKHTDFIFAVFSEEFGFIGGVVLLGLFLSLIIYGLVIATNSENYFGKVLAFGMITMLFLHVAINIAMVMGLLPVVGVPLPLISYGGTIMATTMVALGLVINVSLHSKEII